MSAIESAFLNPAYPPRLDLGPQLTHEQLLGSMQSTMARHKGGPVWLFAYGSLIWRPECTAVERVRGRVHGYHRGLYLWSHEHRGTPEMPGLVFGLDRGGSSPPIAHTGSTAVSKTETRFRHWDLFWSGTCPAMPATCRIMC